MLMLGSFLLAELHMNALTEDVEIRSPRDVRHALNAFRNANFATAYDAIFERIQKVCGTGRIYQRLLKFLILVSQTKEPLSAAAIEHAMAMEPGEVDENFEDDIVSAKEYASLCAGLVVIDGNDVVRLAHKTIGEYLVDRLRREDPDLDRMLARICLAYLRLPQFESGSFTASKADDKARQRILTYPFLPYASRFWGQHASGYLNDVLLEETTSYCTNAGCVSSAAQVMRLSDLSQLRPWDADQGVTGLHLCSYFGLAEAVKSFLSLNTDIDEIDQHGTTPLMYAVQCGKRAVVHELLNAGADPSRTCRRGSTVLHRACQSEHRDILKDILTLKGDIAVDALCTEPFWADQTALSWAICTGNEQIVDLLLQRTELVGLSDNTRAYLEDALFNERTSILESLLKDPRVAESSGKDHEILREMFFLAVCYGRIPFAEVLISHGANIESRDRFQATAIIRTVDSNNDNGFRGFKFLFERADRHSKDMFQRGILHAAGLACNYRVLQHVLENDPSFDVNERDVNNQTPLHDTIKDHNDRGRHAAAECVKLLIRFGANIRIKDHFSKTPVDKARDEGRTDLLTLLSATELEGSDGIEEELTSYSLKAAIKRESDSDLLQYLRRWTREELEAASNWIDPRDRIIQDTVLVTAIKQGKLRSAACLLDHGADPNGIDRFQYTALHHAGMTGNRELAEQLIRVGAHVDPKPPANSRTPSRLAAQRGHYNLALYLVEQGDNDTAKSIERRLLPELLGLACEQGNMIAVERLIAVGAPVVSKDDHNRTPRDRAKTKSHHDIVECIDKAIANMNIQG
jgi:ankyrin repeat protein